MLQLMGEEQCEGTSTFALQDMGIPKRSQLIGEISSSDMHTAM